MGPFHKSHFGTIDRVLESSNIIDGEFSAIHFRAERKGMNFLQCARAVLDAKWAMLEEMAFNGTMNEGQGRPACGVAKGGRMDHPFVLMTSPILR